MRQSTGMAWIISGNYTIVVGYTYSYSAVTYSYIYTESFMALYCFCYALMINDITVNIHSQSRLFMDDNPVYL